MSKIEKIFKNSKKAETFLFVQKMANSIGKLHFDNDVTSNELIALYIKKAICSYAEDETGRLCRAYLNIAILLAFLNRMTTPFYTPSSIDELLDMENMTLEDMVAESVGLIAKAIFEDDSEKIEEYGHWMYEFADELLADEEWDYPDDDPSSGDGAISEPDSDAITSTEQQLKANEEPVPEEIEVPV